MRTVPVFLFPSILVSTMLAAQAPAELPPLLLLDLRTAMDEDPASRILLTPRGCWEGLLLSAVAPAPPTPRRKNEAIVEVWDVAFQETPRQATFRLFREVLLRDIAQALALPMASYAQQDLALLGGYVARHGSAAGVDNVVVQALQHRFNALPPNGCPVK